MKKFRVPKSLETVDRFSVVTKGLLLVVAPLLVQAVFIIVLWTYQSASQRSAHSARLSKEMLLTFHQSQSSFSQGMNRVVLAILLDDSGLRSEGLELIQRGMASLENTSELVHDTPDQVQKLADYLDEYRHLATRLHRSLQINDALPQPGSPNREDEVQELHRSLRTLATQIRDLDSRFQALMVVEDENDRMRIYRFERSHQRIVTILGIGTVASIFVGVFMIVVFSKAFFLRVKIILDNVSALPVGKRLAEPLLGQDELTKIDRAIHSLSRALEERNFETELFIYSVSHDLRTPLVNLHGFSEEIRYAISTIRKFLTDESAPPDGSREMLRIIDEDIQSALSFIKDSTFRMSTIIDALLRLSRAGRAQYEPELIEVASVVDRVLGSLQSMVKESDAEVRIGPLPKVWANAAGLEQILQNLITNAIKYRDPSRPCVIEIGTEPASSAGMATIFVRDNGLGISGESRGKLFLAFQRFHPEVGTGEGIGLALVRRIVVQLGGSVGCESQVGHGSTFTVSLPTSEPVTAMEPRNPAHLSEQ